MKEISAPDPRLYTCTELADLLEQLLIDPSEPTIEPAESRAKTADSVLPSTSPPRLRFESASAVKRPPASSREAAS